MTDHSKTVLKKETSRKEADRGMDFDIRKFHEYKENNRLEVKKAKGGLPDSLWETYSSMANCYGGVILSEYFLDYREMLDPSIRWTDEYSLVLETGQEISLISFFEHISSW